MACSLEISSGPIFADDSFGNCILFWLWILVVLAWILNAMGYFTAKDIGMYFLLLAIGHDPSLHTTKPASDREFPRDSRIRSSSSAAPALLSTKGHAPSLQPGWTPNPAQYFWERPLRPVSRRELPKFNFSDEECAKAVESVLSRPTTAERRKIASDAASLRAKTVRFSDFVEEIPAPPTPELASADQEPLRRLQAALRQPDYSLFAPPPRFWGQIMPCGVTMAVRNLGMPDFGLYGQIQYPTDSFAGAPSLQPASTPAPSPPAGEPQPPPIPPVAGNPGNPIAGAPRPQPANPPSVASTSGNSTRPPNPLMDMSTLQAQHTIDQWMERFLHDVAQIDKQRSRLGGSSHAAWTEATGSDFKRTRFIHIKNHLTDICEWVTTDDGGVDLDKMPRGR